ncbi:MFS transporter [Fervidobacterium thailandense]|uniref:MFS transporter n=1 Tax=Fervidobacterium thailandense TaxID=1008305 RepID=UPI000B251895|nr:MFS transporter [Fervidobacterium thailandense]
MASSFLAIVSHFLLDFLVSFFNPLVPYMIDRFSIQVRVITSFLTLSAAIASLLQIVFGYVFDRVRNKKVALSIVYFTQGIGISLLGFSTNFWMALMSIFLVRIANSAFHPLGAAIAGERSGSDVAFFSIAGTLGAAFGPIFITMYVSRFGGIAHLWLLGLVFVLLGILIRKVPTTMGTGLKERGRLRELFVLLPILAVVTVRSFATSIVHTFTPVLITRVHGYSIKLSGLALTLGMLVGAVSNYVGVLLLRKIGAKRQDLVAFAGMSLSSLLLVLWSDFRVLIFSFLVFDFCAFLLMSANVVQAQEMLPHRKALASSVAMGFAWAIGDFLASGYSALLGNNVKLAIGLVSPISLLAGLYFGVFGRFGEWYNKV